MIKVAAEFGLVVRKRALIDRKVSRAILFDAMETLKPLDESLDMISFGPLFGEEALDEFVNRLQKIGLVYWDDFVEFDKPLPDWCQVFCSS